MVLVYIELAKKILVVLLECIIIEMLEIGGAIAPPVPAPLFKEISINIYHDYILIINT